MKTKICTHRPYSQYQSLTDKEVKLEDGPREGDEGSWSKNDQETPQVLVNALMGVSNFRMTRVTGYLQKKSLHILLIVGPLTIYWTLMWHFIWGVL